MDPNATLAEIRALLSKVTESLDADPTGGYLHVSVAQLVDRVTALDSWIRSGGFLPTAWAHTAGGA